MGEIVTTQGRQRSLLALALLLCAPTASAAPPDPPAVGDAAYADALRDGRRLMARKHFGEAVGAFERAVAARPDDPAALSELGLAALRAGKLPRAVEASKRAVALASEPRLKAASLYNLGRAQQALGRIEEAKASYTESLKLRAKRQVDAALARLTAPPASIAATALHGPFASVAAYCKAFVTDNPGGSCAAKLAPLAGLRLAAPFREVGTFETTSGPADDLASASGANLALRTSRGWFIAEDVLLSGPQGDPKDRASATFPRGRTLDGEAQQPRALAIEYAHNSGRKGEFQAHEEGFFVCGVGAAGPACSEPIRTKATGSRSDGGDSGGGDGDGDDEYLAKLTFLPGPVVAVKVKKRPGPDSELERVLDSGTYRIAFP